MDLQLLSANGSGASRPDSSGNPGSRRIDGGGDGEQERATRP